MYARPKPGETDEDLLRFQEEFLRTKAESAVTLVRAPDKRKSEEHAVQPSTSQSALPQRDVVNMGELPGQFQHTTAAPPRKKTRFKEQQEKKKKESDDSLLDPEERIDRHDTHIAKVLADIVERDIANVPVYYPSMPADGGFPTALHRGKEDSGSSGDAGMPKRSLFARQFAHRPLKDFGFRSVEQQAATEVSSTLKDFVMEARQQDPQTMAGSAGASHMVTGLGLNPSQGDNEAKRIHEENQAKLANMSKEEILAEQRKLAESLDPALVAFLRSKKQASTVHSPKKEPTTESKPPEPRTMDIQAPRDTEELPVKPDKKWVHMDEVEYDKLEWTKEMPPLPKTENSKTGLPARFDLQGNLVAMDAELPTHLGLHHHGKEPERAGYTLEEVFQLSRSANMQQRALALHILSNVITKARSGHFHEVLSTALIPALLEGGLVFVLRWALDDTTDSSMVAAVTSLHALLVCEQDEKCADAVFTWPYGASMPCLSPLVEEEDTSADEEEKPEDTDASVLKRDIIEGLLRMHLLPRLRYILEVWRPAASVVVNILQILTRIVRHSPQSAYQVTQCPRLMDTIFKEFLPQSWKDTDASEPLSMSHGYPMGAALKLVRVISSAGRHMAANLAANYSLMSRVARYIAQQASDLPLPLDAAVELQMESLRVWQVLMAYGLETKSFSELYPVLSAGIQRLAAINSTSTPVDIAYGASLLSLLQAMTHVAASATELSLQKHRGQPMSDLEAHDSQPIPELNWSHVTGLLQPIEQCMERRLQEFSDKYALETYDLTFTASCIEFVASFYSRAQSQPGYDAIEILGCIERLSSGVLMPCLKSLGLKRALKALRNHSVLLHEGGLKRSECPLNLPELGSLFGDGGTPCPMLQEGTSCHLILALTRMLLVFGKLHKDLPQLLYPLLMGDEDLLLYLRKCCHGKVSVMATNTFSKFESLLHYQLIKMGTFDSASCDTMLIHKMALCLLTRLHPGDEHIGHDLLSTVIFNQKFIGDLHSDEGSIDLEKLQLREAQITMATQQVVTVQGTELTQDIVKHLVSIRGTYLSSVAALAQQLPKSRSRLLHIPQDIDRLVLGVCGQLLVPMDWVFIPLVALYENSAKLSSKGEQSLPPNMVTIATDTLRWLFYLESWRPEVLQDISPAAKFSRIMCTFLAGSDLFLEPWVHAYLAALFKQYCKPVVLHNMDFSKSIPGIPSFYDMYISFLHQYEAVSFGDSLFGCFVLLPMQQQHSLQLRQAVWSEHQTVLQSLLIPVKEVLIPVERFLDPEETHTELLNSYLRALLGKMVTPHRSPVPYLIAVHHVNRFMFTREGSDMKLRKKMLTIASAIKDQLKLSSQDTDRKQALVGLQRTGGLMSESLRQHLLYYCRADVDSAAGMELYAELPAIRQQTLDEVQGAQS